MPPVRSRLAYYSFAALGAATVLLFISVYASLESDAFTVSFLDVGQGDAILARSSEGADILIDSGKGKKILEKLGSALPLWDRRIEFIVLTHPDQDHIGGFPDVLERYEVGAILLTGVKRDELPAYQKIISQAEERKIPLMFVHSGTEISLGSNATLKILAPHEDLRGVAVSDTNNTSIVALLSVNELDLLLMGDAEIREEREVMARLASLPPPEVLKVGHHGSRSSSGEEFLQAVTPKVAVFSVGTPNPYGHPHPEVLSRLQSLGAEILRTDSEGDIIFTTDGAKLFRMRHRFPTLASLLPFAWQREFVLEGE